MRVGLTGKENQRDRSMRNEVPTRRLAVVSVPSVGLCITHPGGGVGISPELGEPVPVCAEAVPTCRTTAIMATIT